MTYCKDLKRNFHELIAELESNAYLKPADPSVRSERIRAGSWRVHLEIHPDRVRSANSLKPTVAPAAPDEAVELVRLYHLHRFEKQDHSPPAHEIAQARRLLKVADEEMLRPLTERTARIVEEQYHGNDLHFGAAAPYLLRAVAQRQVREQRLERHQASEVQNADDDSIIQ